MMLNNTTKLGSVKTGDRTEIDIPWVTAYFIEAFAIVLANLLTIITFTINRHLRKRSMYCVINLAVADMLTGFEESVSDAIIWKMQGRIERNANLYQNSILWRVVLNVVMGTGTTLSLPLVAVERLCATVWPLRHRNARPWTYTLGISVIWTIAAMNGLLVVMGRSTISDRAITLDKIPSMLIGIGICMTLGVISMSYILIFIKVKKQQQLMAGQRISTRDKRLVMTLFIVTATSIGTWIPLALVSLLKSRDIASVPLGVNGAAGLLSFSSSLVNPIIYVFRMKDFRKALLHLILKCSRHRPRQVVPQPS